MLVIRILNGVINFLTTNLRFWINFPFQWKIGAPLMMGRTHHHSLENVELNNLILPRQWDIYRGPRKSRTVEARWEGSLDELQIGMVVPTLVDNDELSYSFWIAIILEIMKDEQGNYIKSIVVHWYYTSSPNAITRKYSLEMVKDVYQACLLSHWMALTY